MDVRDYHLDDIEDIIKLTQLSYNEEKNAINFLKPINDYSVFIEGMFYKRFGKNAFGKVLIDNQEIIGYLIGIEIDEFWGKSKGFLSPIHGHYVVKKYRREGYQLLYKTLAKELVKKEILSHAITLYTNDKTLIEVWFNLGFGLRCEDAVKKLENKTIDSNIEIKPLTITNANDFAALEESFHMMFTKSPLFMPKNKINGHQHILDIISKENHYMFGAYLNNQAVGLIQLGPIGDNFITTHEQLMNVKGLYIDEKYRKKGIAKNLLVYAENFLLNKGYELLGVDFESFNIYGSDFWHKYFKTYTNSLHRRIDEFIVEVGKG